MVATVVKKGDLVVDATAGNGNDTVFLADLVGEEGKVYSFDIQSKAIEKTRDKLIKSGFQKRVELICDGHQNMDQYVSANIKAVMFNLGYLPGGDHTIGTKGHSTIDALNKAMNLIAKNGIISMVVYYGGDSGFEEKEQVMEFIENIDCRAFTIMKTEFINQVNCPPIFVCIEKL